MEHVGGISETERKVTGRTEIEREKYEKDRKKEKYAE
jgi:hypothetical protein